MEFTLLIIYILFLGAISIIVTVYDKIAAKNHRWRTPERFLLTLAALGGAGAMLLVMKLIRHKTQKMKFMVSLPIFLVLHILLFGLYCHWMCP